MKNFDEIRDAAQVFEDGGKFMEAEGSQDDVEHELGVIAKGALDWATDQATPMAKRFEALLGRFFVSVRRSQPHKKRKQAERSVPSGDPW